MADVFESEKSPRYAWLALVLSLVDVGLGQVYCGSLARGLFFACLGTLSIPVTAAILANQTPAGGFKLVTTVLVGVGVIVAIAALDAYHLARRTRHDYPLKEYNRLSIYFLLFLLTKGGALGALLYTRDHMLEAFLVPTSSMSPNIVPGDRVLGNKRAYDTSDPQRGDIVIFRSPDHWRSTNIIKRIVAVAGDTVEIKEGRVKVNGAALESKSSENEAPASAAPANLNREYNGAAQHTIAQTPSATSQPTQLAFLKVPPNHCFVLGDNPSASHDSRDFGAIPLTSIVARADYLYWPATSWTRFGRIGTAVHGTGSFVSHSH